MFKYIIIGLMMGSSVLPGIAWAGHTVTGSGYISLPRATAGGHNDRLGYHRKSAGDAKSVVSAQQEQDPRLIDKRLQVGSLRDKPRRGPSNRM